MEKGLGAVLVTCAVIGSIVVVACGDSDEGSKFSDTNQQDSGPPLPGDLVPDGSAPEGGGDALPPVECEVNVPDKVDHKWTAPTTSTDACTTEQLGSYFDECLDENALGDPTKCEAWRKAAANATCKACIEPANKTGWVRWYDEPQSYYLLNSAGCINVADPDADACAAAFDKVAECTRLACSGCLAPGGNYEDFRQCRRDARSEGICAGYVNEQATACQGVTAADGGTAAACHQKQGETFKDLFVRIGATFCGPS